MMPPKRVGLVGLGAVSRFYLASIARVHSLTLAAVCDVDRASLARMADQAGIQASTDHRDILHVVDAVIVATPNDEHFNVCRDALEAGVAVCVEKPLTTCLADGAALVNTAREQDLALFTAFHRRYNAAVLALARRLAHQPPIESVVVRYLENIEDHAGHECWYLDPSRCGGGCVADNGPNAFDLVRLLIGDVQVTKASVGRGARGLDVQAVVILEATSGATAHVELDWAYQGERKDMEVHLADGSRHRLDMLSGHPGFKASLWHEYVGVLQDFALVLSAGGYREDGGLAALSLVDATYRLERLDGPATPTPAARNAP